ncbi:MAG: phosphoribosyl-ATP pyrophosphohydrolase [Cellulosilyticum sp.]|nr:phosphoribosyl-ATP pyrophosphohydrolase [Cellulosilyticum sp.]
MKAYDKLVRDLIPQIIEAGGKHCEVEVVEGKEVKVRLEEKLIEEFNEYLEDNNLEELADMMEVIFGLAHQLGYSDNELLEKRQEKLEARGGFKKGIILKKVY